MDLIGLTIIITVPCFFIKSFWDLLTGKTKPQERPKKLSKKEQELQERKAVLFHDNNERYLNSHRNICRMEHNYTLSVLKAEDAYRQLKEYSDECDKLIREGDFESYEKRIPSYPYQ